MADAASGRDVGLKLCEVFGLDPESVSKITIVADAGGVARVIVERAVREPTETDPLIHVVRSFAGEKKFKVEWKDP